MTTILAFFTDNGTPATGLFPIIKIREMVTGDLALASGDSDVLDELGDGLYKFDFNGDETLNYAFVIDGGVSLTTADRHVYGGTELQEVHNKLEFIKQVESGRWKIDSTTNQVIFFKDDNTTELFRCNLFDISGTPTIDDVTERRRV